MSIKSSSDLTALVKAIEALAAQQSSHNKMVAALLASLPAVNATALNTAEEAPIKGGGGKRGRKPKSDKEPKVKTAPPPAEDGALRFSSASEGDYKEFSSFFKAPFTVGDKEYISLANYFHSQKFAETDDEFSEDIRTQKNPALTRAKASSVKEHAPRADWAEAKLNVMRTGLLAKFRAHPALLAKLVGTGDARLESTIDEEMRVKDFWSIGESGSGANHMGELLMSVRAELSGAAVATSAPKAKPAAAAKKAVAAPAEEADSDSDSDSDEEEEEAPKPVAKPAVKAVAKPVAKPAAPAPVEADSDSESDSDDDE